MKNEDKNEISLITKYRSTFIKITIIVVILLCVIGGLFWKGYTSAEEKYESIIAELEAEIKRLSDPVAVYEEASEEVNISLINSEIQNWVNLLLRHLLL